MLVEALIRGILQAWKSAACYICYWMLFHFCLFFTFGPMVWCCKTWSNMLNHWCQIDLSWQMGKRKSRAKPPPKKRMDKLDTVFSCPFCNHGNSVECRMLVFIKIHCPLVHDVLWLCLFWLKYNFGMLSWTIWICAS